MQIHEIYARYRIMPTLQTHMYRVAAVGQLICQASKVPLVQAEIISTCLLHDMGNIIKFDLSVLPEFLQPEGPEYWQNVQQEYIQKYGSHEHEATLKIAQELRVPPHIIDLLHGVSFYNQEVLLQSSDLGQKICEYADMRVTPFGVVSLRERLEDLERRYSSKYPGEEHQTRRKNFATVMKKIENEIFAQSSITPNSITDATTQPLIANLKFFEIIGS